MLWHDIWLQCGRPRNGFVSDIRRSSRAKYHYELKLLQRNDKLLRKKRMCELIQLNDNRDLWWEIKKLKPTAMVSTSILDGFNNDADIANCLRSKYEKLYNSVPTADEEMKSIKRSLKNDIKQCPNNIIVAVNDVVQAVKLIKPGKGDGDRGFTSDHIINGNTKLFVILSLLFQCMIVHGFSPSLMLSSTIISIPKDKRGDLTTSDNYRGISLCNSLCKVFDTILINKYEKQLKSSDLQFAFKKNHSTIMCTAIMKDIVARYLTEGSNVYGCLVDASKAFDKIHFGKLFLLLVKRKIPSEVLRLLLFMHEKQSVTTQWNNCKSDSFGVSNGVRQGAVLSTLLFTVYMDELILRLKTKGIGCYIGIFYAGCIAYADDLTLLCPSVSGLQNMLAICEKFGCEYSVSYNAKKTQCIVFGRKPKRNVCNIYLNNQILSWKQNVCHLGNNINFNLDDALDIEMKKASFIGSVNNLMSHFGNIPTILLNDLFCTYCCAFYGSQVWNLRDSHLLKFSTMYNKALRRVWNLPHNSHCVIIHQLSKRMSFLDIVACRFYNMYNKMLSCDNPFVNRVASKAVDNGMTFIGSNLHYIKSTYNVSDNKIMVHRDSVVNDCIILELC